MKHLILLNDPPYGTERSFNGLRHAQALLRRENVALRLFLIGGASACAKQGQKVPQGYYNVEIMLNQVVKHNAQIGVCGTCLDARGIAATELITGCQRSNMDELAEWTVWADKVLVY